MRINKNLIAIIIGMLLLYILYDHYFWAFHHQKNKNLAYLNLNNYVVDIDKKEIVGVDQDLSGLTYNKKSGTLFAVINRPSKIIELTTSGDLIREIDVEDIYDVEGITHISDNKYFITEESSQTIFEVIIDNDTKIVNRANTNSLGIGFGNLKSNKGFEGIEWNPVDGSLYVVKEKKPLKVIKISGMATIETSYNLDIREWFPNHKHFHVKDLSSVFVHAGNQNIFLTSDKTKIVCEYDQNGDLLSYMWLKKGLHKLSEDIPQAEGLAIDDDDNVYLVSEPNLFYRFKKMQN